MIALEVQRCVWRLKQPFTIARGTRTEQHTLRVTLIDENKVAGRGGASPIGYRGETIDSLIQAIEGLRPLVEAGLDREDLRRLMLPGGARAALDAALWDLEARRRRTSVAALANRPAPRPVTTAYTISLDAPEAMAAQARANRQRPLLKVKLGGGGVAVDMARAAAVRAAAPDACLVADINAAWSADELRPGHDGLADQGFALIEQPLAVGADAALADFARRIPICADESCNTRADLPGLVGRYDAINIKLEKAGGLTEALALKAAARQAGLRLFIGCMLGSSLGTAPAMLLAQDADWIDLDGPLLLAQDDVPALAVDGSLIHPPEPELWG